MRTGILDSLVINLHSGEVMRIVSIFVVLSCCLITSTAFADEITELKAQIRELKEQIKEQNERTSGLTQTVTDLKNTIGLQQKEINSLKKAANPTPAAPAETPLPVSVSSAGAVTQEQVQKLNNKVDQIAEAQKKTFIDEFNPNIKAVGETLLGYRTGSSTDTKANKRPAGFDIYQRSMELDVAASIDQFARGYVIINGSADSSTSDAEVDVKEAAIQTTSLPWDLTLTAGRFFGEFGKLAQIYDHALPFVPRPLVLERFIGGESQTDGAQISWRLPIKQYVKLTAGLGDKFGNPPNNPGTFRDADGLNYFGHLSTYFDLPQDWHMEIGISGLINPRTKDRGGALTQPDGNTLTEKERRLAGADFSLCYTPLKNDLSHSLTWGNEVLYSNNRYDDKPIIGNDFYESVRSVGLYSYLAYRIDPHWTIGFLLDFCESDQNNQDRTAAFSPYLTYAFSPWNQLRLEYGHTVHSSASPDKDGDAIFLQWVWSLGSHSGGWKPR